MDLKSLPLAAMHEVTQPQESLELSVLDIAVSLVQNR
jgi:hypothetical protein